MWRAVNSSDGEYSDHGAMDYVDDYRLMYCLRRGLPTDMNVYDAAVLSAVVELSERSVREGGRPVEFPDFTRAVAAMGVARIVSLWRDVGKKHGPGDDEAGLQRLTARVEPIAVLAMLQVQSRQ